MPLAAGVTMLDLARELALPVLVVARGALGTINHTLLTLEALASRGIPLAGVVLSHGPDAALAAGRREPRLAARAPSARGSSASCRPSPIPPPPTARRSSGPSRAGGIPFAPRSDSLPPA